MFSPETYVKNWNTPMMIIHGGNDYRVPLTEGLSAFTALQLKGIPSEFLFLHEENHWALKAENQVKWFDEVFKFFDKYIINIPKTTVHLSMCSTFRRLPNMYQIHPQR